MYERYHIHVEAAPPRYVPVPKFLMVRADNCINCGKCERNCVYGVHKRREDDPRQMAEPMSQLCKNCFRCVADCPQRALSLSLNQEFLALGSGVWTPQRIQTIWNESEMGKIPVLGAGYRGMFSGPGYDAMWTDMSEIVQAHPRRHTRSGAHLHQRHHRTQPVLPAVRAEGRAAHPHAQLRRAAIAVPLRPEPAGTSPRRCGRASPRPPPR